MSTIFDPDLAFQGMRHLYKFDVDGNKTDPAIARSEKLFLNRCVILKNTSINKVSHLDNLEVGIVTSPS